MQEFLFGAVFLVVIISGIFSFFEIAFIRKFFKIKSTKYIKLLKILEIFIYLCIDDRIRIFRNSNFKTYF